MDLHIIVLSWEITEIIRGIVGIMVQSHLGLSEAGSRPFIGHIEDGQS